MTEITAQNIKELRDRTGVGMSKCKEALVEAKGDMQKAIDNLRKAGMTSAVKKEGREAKEGMIGFAEDAQSLVLIEANSETDFVSQNEKFAIFVKELCEQALQAKPASLEEFLQEPYKRDPKLTIEQCRNLMVQSFGENIVINRMVIIPKTAEVSIGVYSHLGGKLVSVVELEGKGEESFARELAMHAAAEDPEYLSPEDVPAQIKEREEEIARSQVKGKPENIIDKIVTGKFKSYCEQVCLNLQKFIKDSDKTVQQVIEAKAKETGKPLKIRQFWRWKVGEK